MSGVPPRPFDVDDLPTVAEGIDIAAVAIAARPKQRSEPRTNVSASALGKAVPLAMQGTAATAVRGTIVQLDGAGGQYPLGQGRSLTFGRDQRCDIILLGTGVSRVHASIHYDGENFVIDDQGSRNGVQINGSPAKIHNLVNGDLFAICEHRFRFDAGGDDDGFTNEHTAMYGGQVGRVSEAADPAMFPVVQGLKPAPSPGLSGSTAQRRPARFSNIYALLGGLAVAMFVVLLLIVGSFVLGRQSAAPDGPGVAVQGFVTVGAVVPIVASSAAQVTTVIARVGQSITSQDLVAEVVRAWTPAQEALVRKNLEVAVQAGEAGVVSTLEGQLKEIAAQTPTPLLAGVAGRVLAVHVAAGDEVKAGQPLFDIDAPSYGLVEVDVSTAAVGLVSAGRVGRVRFADGFTVYAPVIAVASRGGGKAATLLLPIVRQEWAAARPFVEFP